MKKAVIAEAVTLPPLLDHWVRRGRFPQEAEDRIDWEANKRAMDDSAVGLGRWVTKHAAGMCGVGKFLKLWGREDTDQCPLCGAPEDAAHVLVCPDDRAVDHWNDRVAKLSDWMDSRSTHPDIKSALLDLLHHHRFGSPLPETVPQSIAQAVKSQRIIGPRGLTEGLLAREWASLQDAHYRALPAKRRSGNRWAALLIEQLWEMGFSMWEHRNKIMHSPDSVQAKQDLEKADTQIQEEFGTGGADLPTSAQHLFRLTLKQRLKQNLSDKEHWLRLVKLEREHARANSRQLRLQRRRFENHFQTPTRP